MFTLMFHSFNCNNENIKLDKYAQSNNNICTIMQCIRAII